VRMAGVLVAGLVFVAPACNGGGDGPTSSTRSPSASPTPGSPPPTTASVSQQCLDAMEAAAAEPDPAAADPLIVRTLDACASVDEWLEALRRHPGAMGLTERAEIGDLDVQSVCFGSEDTRVCVERGR
jgi:hypothetical protein